MHAISLAIALLMCSCACNAHTYCAVLCWPLPLSSGTIGSESCSQLDLHGSCGIMPESGLHSALAPLTAAR